MASKTTTKMYLNIETTIGETGTITRSGNTVINSGTFTVSQDGTYYNTNAIYAKITNSDGTVDKTSWVKVKNAGNVRSGSATWSFSFVDPNAGSATYRAYFQVFNNAESGPVGDPDWVTFSRSWNAGTPGPSGGYINGLSTAYNASTGLIDVTATSVGVTDVGSGTLDYSQFLFLEVPYVSGVARQMVEFTNGGSVLLNQNNSTAQNGGITITFNHLYHSGIYAANSNYPTTPDYRYQGPTVVSIAAPPTVTFSSATTTSATFSYSMPADAGYYNKKLQYSLDGTTWVDVTTATGTSAKTGTFTVSSLEPAHSYTLRVRTSTTAGNTSGANVAFSTASSLYCSVNAKTKRVKKLYCSVNGKTKKVKKLYGSVNGKTKLVYEG